MPLFFLRSLYFLQPVPYSGKVSINGVNYHGEAKFTFALQDKDGKVRWRNGTDGEKKIRVQVFNGRYTVLLGGQGMNVLPPQLFLDYDELYLRVRFDNGDGQGLRNLTPYQRITATPRALVAEVAKQLRSRKQQTANSGEGRWYHHCPVERADTQIFKTRNYPCPAGTGFDLWRTDCHPAFPSRGKVSILSMVQEWSANRRGDG